MSPPHAHERRALALLLVLLGLAALVMAADAVRAGTMTRDDLPLPVVVALLTIMAGSATLGGAPRRRLK